jgi:hypothetical protein
MRNNHFPPASTPQRDARRRPIAVLALTELKKWRHISLNYVTKQQIERQEMWRQTRYIGKCQQTARQIKMTGQILKYSINRIMAIQLMATIGLRPLFWSTSKSVLCFVCKING